MIAPDARRAFVLAHTRLQRPPHVPELQLHLADEVTPIWCMTEAALEAHGLAPPFWAFAWAGGQALARWLLDHPEAAAGRRVLDFASGSGVVGIAAALSGAAEVLCADVDPFAAAACALNAAANGVAVRTTDADLLAAPPPRDVELICAGDVAYERPLAGRVRAWLAQAGANGARVLVGDPRRSYFDAAGLEPLAEYDVAVTRELEDAEVKRTGVWALA